MRMKQSKEEKNAISIAKSGKKKVWVAVIAILLVAGILIGNVVGNTTTQAEITEDTIEVIPIECRDLSDSISIKGSVSGVSKTNVVSVASAEVTGVNVQVGDIVEAGDLLVTLDSAEIEKQIADTKTDIYNANAIATNNANLVAKGLEQAKEDQSSALEKASKQVEQANANYKDCQDDYYSVEAGIVSRREKLTEVNNTITAADGAVKEAATVLESAKAAYEADKENAELKTAYENAEIIYNEKLTAYETAVATQTTLNAEITELQTKLQGCSDAIKSAQSVVNDANAGYNDTVTATNRSVESAQNTVDMAKYQTADNGYEDKLESLELQLADCSMVAPCGGVVTAVNVSTGDTYTAGATMITIEDTSKMKVIVTVEEADILKIQEGMEAVITTDATGDEEIAGTVSRVVRVKNQSVNQSEVNTSNGYSAEIAIDNTELLIGMSAKARIILQKKESVLAVPYDLIQYDENGEAYVLVAELAEDGTATATRRNITVGDAVDYYVEVEGGELQEGELLIYDYTYSIMEGSVFTPEQTYLNAGTTEEGVAGVEAK